MRIDNATREARIDCNTCGAPIVIEGIDDIERGGFDTWCVHCPECDKELTVWRDDLPPEWCRQLDLRLPRL